MEEKRMRNIVIATLVAAGFALAGASAGSAAPVNGTVLKQAQAATSTQTLQVRWRCHGYYSRWHWCY
jgi:hypothetical protein